MYEIFNEIQNAASIYHTATLIAVGVLAVVLGIIIWLAGTKATGIIGAIVGFVGGSVGAYYLFADHQTEAAISGAIIGAIIAMILHRFIAAVTGLAIFAAAVLIFLIGTNYTATGRVVQSKQQSTMISVKLTAPQTIQEIRLKIKRIVETVYYLSIGLSAKIWPAFIAALAGAALIAIFFRRLAVAFACSSMGVGLIFFGMATLLLYKGSAPLTYAYGRITFFFTVFAVMTLAGTIVQMLLCGPPKLKMLKEEQEIKKDNPGERKCTYQRS